MVESSVGDLKMEFLIKLQSQDFIGAQAIQRELMKLVPHDKTIREFSKYLPAEIEFQKETTNDQEEEEYEEEDYDEEEKDSEEEQPPPEEVKEDKGQKTFSNLNFHPNGGSLLVEDFEDPDAAACSNVGDTFGVNPGMAAEAAGLLAANDLEESKQTSERPTTSSTKPGDQTGAEEEAEDSYDDDYNPEYYDEEGRYIWGDKDDDWEFYNQEDEDAYNQGRSHIPDHDGFLLNPSALPDDPQPEDKTGVAIFMKAKPKPAPAQKVKPTPLQRQKEKLAQSAKTEVQSKVYAQIASEGAMYITAPKTKLKGGDDKKWRSTVKPNFGK